jgi:nitrite reductase/ring-hydroxylating ferredoxin subunit/uncharacterized membrane protein
VADLSALLRGVVTKIEGAKALDHLSKPLAAYVQRLVAPRAVRNALSGTSIGHPLHPLLTDVPIGAWTMSTVLDVAGPAFEPAADLLVGVGILAALPTAAAGWNDWSDLIGGEQRIGLVHAGVNIAALSLFTTSLVLRRTGHRRAGRLVGMAASAGLAGGGYLGGHLAFSRGIGVNRAAFEERSSHWQPVLADEDLPAGQLMKVMAGDASIVLCRSGGSIRALSDRCTHAGGPLHEGKLDGDCVVCPWHGSEFRLDDGGVVRGPATTPQPVYETRVREGQIEVRAAASS